MAEDIKDSETRELSTDYEYTRPEGEPEVEERDSLEFSDMQEEVTYHQERLAFRFVKPAGDKGWSKESVLKAIGEGHVDAFSVNWITFPPVPGGHRIPQHTAYYFDDREFGDKVANAVLKGFKRPPRNI